MGGSRRWCVGHRRALWLVLVLVGLLLGLTSAPAALAGGDEPVRKDIGGKIAIYSTNNGCTVHVELWFPDVGADSYEYSYWDGYWKRDITGVAPPFGEQSGAPAGTHVIGIAGLFGSGPVCDPAPTEADYRSRFDGAVKVVAVFAPGTAFISGKLTVADCSEQSGTCSIPGPLEGATVTAKGRKTSSSATTAADGSYSIKVTDGTYTVTPGFPDASFDPSSRKVKVKGDTRGVDFRACRTTAEPSPTSPRRPTTSSRFNPCAGLEVTMRASPAPVVVPQAVDGPVPTDVRITVTVRNRSKEPIDFVTLQDELTVGYRSAARTEALPLRLKGKGKAKVLGTLKPGQEKSGTYTYVARGDGELELTALVTASRKGKPVRAIGSTDLDLTTKALVITGSLGRRVRSPDAPALVKAGTAWTLKLSFANRSFTRKLIVFPLGMITGRGNVRGGRFVVPGAKIQVDDFANLGLETAAADVLPPVIELEPRTTSRWEVVLTSDYSDSRQRGQTVAGKPGKATSPGGTRAELKLGKPEHVWVDPEDGSDPVALDPGQVLIDDDARAFRVGIDDRAPDRPPFSGAGDLAADWAAFTLGMSKGAAAWASAAIHGIVHDLPLLLAQGLIATPVFVQKATQLQVEAWAEIRQSPVSYVPFLDVVAAQALVVAKTAPGLVKDADAFQRQVRESVFAQYEQAYNEYYDGDWLAASETLGNDAAKKGLDIATAIGPVIGPAILARFRPAIEAAQASRASVYARVADALVARLGASVTARVAIEALTDIRPGFEFSDALLKQIYGMTQREIDYLREFAAKNNVLITIRSRAWESIRLVEDLHAFMKPEQIKLKTVNWIDVEYLGYRFDEVGSVVVREPKSRAEVIRQLRNEGWEPGTRQYDNVIERIDLREFEWTTDEPQYVKDMLRWAEDGKAEFEWNWSENLNDPSIQPNEARTVGFQMEREVVKDAKGKIVDERWVPKVDEVGNGEFRIIAGDIDTVAITDLTSSALTDEEHVRIFKLLRQGPLKTPHAETATWTKDGKFVFPKKLKFLPAGCCLAQFGPDRIARAVRLDLSEKFSKLVSAENYWLYQEGGYVHP